MARLGIPALYHLDVGSGEWGWHKMTDLVLCVNNLLERSLLNTLTAEEVGRKYSYLNNEPLFGCSNDHDIDFVEPEEINWSDTALFVPAGWSMKVISAVKRQINHPEPVIMPSGRIQIPTKANRGFAFVQPAILTDEEVVVLLSKFSGKTLIAMRRLLVDHHNEPLLEEGPLEQTVGLWETRSGISQILASIEAVGGKKFRLANYKKRGGGRFYQLWEIASSPQPTRGDEAPSVLKADFERESNITRGAGDPNWQQYRDGD